MKIIKIKIVVRLVLGELKMTIERQLPLTAEDVEAQLERLINKAKAETISMAWEANDLGISSPHILVVFAVDGSVYYTDMFSFVSGKAEKNIQQIDRWIKMKTHWIFRFAKITLIERICCSR